MNRIPSGGATPVSLVTGDRVARVASDSTVADVATTIADEGVGAVVIGEQAWPTAVVTERDVVRVVAAGHDPATVRALDIASTKLVWCPADATVDEVAARMMDHYIRHIFVEQDGELVGIVSARDLLGVYGANAEVTPA